ARPRRHGSSRSSPSRRDHRRVPRIHTALAFALIAFIPAGPLAMWLYARTASADRAAVIRANERVLRSVRPLAGTRPGAEHSYAIPRWGNEGGLVPTSGYGTEFLLQLPHATAAAEVVAHYRGELRGGREL